VFRVSDVLWVKKLRGVFSDSHKLRERVPHTILR
jgi:hypothetical protein